MSTEQVTQAEVKSERNAVEDMGRSPTLYVGDLPVNVTEEKLYTIVEKVVKVAEVKICRDSSTNISRGFGFITFNSADDAEQAMKHLNFTRIENKEIRLMFNQPNPALRQSGAGNIIVTNLSACIDNQTMFETFSVFGEILSSRVSFDEDGNSKGYGFVHYKNPEDAQKAISKVNGNEIAGKIVRVMEFIPRSKRPKTVTVFTNLYVKNFNVSIFPSEDSFRKFFSTYGTVTSVNFPMKDNGEPVGFAFVNFDRPEVAISVLEKLNNKEPEKLYISKAVSKEQRQRELRSSLKDWRKTMDQRTAGRNVYIKNLPEIVSTEVLAKEMSSFGQVESCKVETDGNKRSRGFGYVLFADRSQATMAIKELDKKVWSGKMISVCLFQRKEVRVEHQRMQRAASASRRAAPTGYDGQNFILQQHPALFQQSLYNAQLYQGGMTPAQLAANQQAIYQQGALPQAGLQRIMAHPSQMAYMNPPAQLRPTSPATWNAQPSPSKMEIQQPSEDLYGETLYGKIHSLLPDKAGKITGMLLELPVEQQARLCADDAYLRSHLEKAVQLLNSQEE